MKKIYSLLALGLLATSPAFEAILLPQANVVYADDAKTVEENNKSTKAETKWRALFDQIAVGDMMAENPEGSSLDDVKKLLGEPKESEKDDSYGIETEIMTWEKKSTTITLTFSKNKVVHKEIQGYLYNRTSKIGLKEFNALADNLSYADAVKTLGNPDGYSEMIIDGENTKTAYWQTGIKRKNGDATIVLTFDKDVLTSKTQQELKD